MRDAEQDGMNFWLSRGALLYTMYQTNIKYLFLYLSEVNSKSVDTEGLILKSCSKEVVDQSCNICSVFGRN